MSGPFSPSETRYEDNKATWLPEVGFASAANNREKDEACALYETSPFSVIVVFTQTADAGPIVQQLYDPNIGGEPLLSLMTN